MKLVLGVVALAAIALAFIALTAAVIVVLRRSAGRHGTSGSLSSAMVEVEALLDPAKRHTVHAIRAEEGETDDEGAPPGE